MENIEIHPLAPEHLPRYIVAADGSDYVFTVMVYFTVIIVLLIGVAYLTLHSLPERMAHKQNHSQLQLIGILAILALFTHNNAFWIIAILVAAFRMPDFMTPLRTIASSLSKIAEGKQENINSQDHKDEKSEPAIGPASTITSPNANKEER